MSLLAIGDLHLSDDREWSSKVSQLTVDLILNHKMNNSNNEAIFLGDLTEKAFLSGQVFAMLERLFKGLKFKKVYVLKGNHDIKKNRVGEETFTLDFIRTEGYENIILIEELMEATISGNRCLMLPHFSPYGERTMKKVYESLPKDKEYDVIFGHFQDTSLNLPGESIDISYLTTKHICLGHTHNPDNNYIGSIIPNSTAEAGKLRRFISFNNGEKEIIPIRTIVDYYEVDYPDPLPTIQCDVPIFTVFNCADVNVAKEKYGNHYIKEVKYKVSMDIDGFKSLGASKADAKLSIIELFKEFKNIKKFDPPSLGDRAEVYLNSIS